MLFNQIQVFLFLKRSMCTSEYGILYNKGEKSDLIGFTDIDYAGEAHLVVFKMGSGAVSWSS